MGFSDFVFPQLAPIDLAVVHVRFPAIWDERRGIPPRQCLFSWPEHVTALRRSQTDDRLALAERLGGGALCRAPAARGIGRLGCGAQGRLEYVFWHANTLGLCALRGTATTRALSWRAAFL